MVDCIVHKAIEIDKLSAKVKANLPSRRWIVSPKYDGCHAIFLFEDGEHVGTYSRSGEVVLSMHHVGQDLLKVYPFLQEGKRAICGEAWTKGKEFNEISGMFRRHSPQLDLHFVPFDHVNFFYVWSDIQLCSDQPYHKRIASLFSRYVINGNFSVAPIAYWRCVPEFSDALAHAVALAKSYKALGCYDGMVLADADGVYTVGAGKGGEFLKIKPLLSYTVTVTGAALDFGTKTGKNTAALKFMLDGKEQKVSTGLTQQQVEEITAVGWDGYHIEVEAMGKTINGYLREPRFKGIRTDA